MTIDMIHSLDLLKEVKSISEENQDERRKLKGDMEELLL